MKALGASISGIGGFLCVHLLGMFLDSQTLPLHTQIRYAFLVCAITSIIGLSLVTASSIQLCSRSPCSQYDWADAGYAFPFTAYLLQSIAFNIAYYFVIFYTGFICKDSPHDKPHAAASTRALTSAMAAIAFGLASRRSFAELYGAVFSLALLVLAVGPAGVGVWRHTNPNL